MKLDSLNTRATEVLSVGESRQQPHRFYDRLASFYDVLSQLTVWPVRQRVLAALAAQPGERILEIGPDAGHNLAELAHAVRPDGHIHGLDLTEAMSTRARALLQGLGLSECVKLRWGDAVDLPYLNDTMDGILMTFTLELFAAQEIPEALAECRRVLRPGGRLVVASLTSSGGAGNMQHLLERSQAHLPQEMDRQPVGVWQALEDAGFQIDSVEVVYVQVPVEIVRGIVVAERVMR